MAIFSTTKETEAAKPAEDKAVKGAGKKKADAKPAATKETKAKTDKKASMTDLYASDKAAVKKDKDGKEIIRKNKDSRAYSILVKPLITEKAANLGMLNKYVFTVSLDANKIEIAKAVETVYGIKPVSVNVIRTEGKIVRRGKYTGTRKDWKKAMVTLPKGKTINIYEGV